MSTTISMKVDESQTIHYNVLDQHGNNIALNWTYDNSLIQLETTTSSFAINAKKAGSTSITGAYTL